MKMRNGANNAWITLYQLDGEWSTIAFENGTAAAPSIYFKDSGTDTGIYSPGADQVGISTGGTARITVDGSGNVNIDSNTLYVDAANNRVGIGVSGPQSQLQVLDQIRVSNSAQSQGSIVLGDGSSTAFNVGIARWNGSTNAAGAGGIGYFSQGLGNVGGHYFYTGDAAAGSQTARLIVNPSGNVGIGTTGPGALLDVAAGIRVNSAGSVTSGFANGVNMGGYDAIGYDANDLVLGGYRASQFTALRFYTAGTDRARIDSSGRLLVGTSSARTNFYNTSFAAGLQVESITSTNRGLALVNNSAADNPSSLILARSNADTIGSNAVVASDTWLGNITFQGADGSEFVEAARIDAYVDGTPGANDMPGRLVFSTTADGAASPTERMRIDNAGNVMIATTNSNIGGTTTTGVNLTTTGVIRAGASGQGAALFNRISNDGDIVFFQQDGATEGSISVSGTTVSYNGAHLSRWSQLPGGAEREEILRGSVLSNLDEMCEWGEEDNEQLNRMKVSDVEGDPNVSGVFQAWDDDDDTYTDDFYCAMTGDFIIRIAEGVTVQRGDLLMSAGDGTAKPQDDDIIRSKTIAKVTSTHVTCTHDDGSYCVPCVLMAC
jgi:hypothetical protein